MRTRRLKIVSGGQTGVDRGALDAALSLGTACGGWCPAGRLDEFGRIPERYPLSELPEGGFKERTIRNVEDSHGTLVLYFAKPEGGTETTVIACVQRGKPYKLIDCAATETDSAVEVATAFVQEHGIEILNVAGPRASEEPSAYEVAFQVISGLVQNLNEQESN